MRPSHLMRTITASLTALLLVLAMLPVAPASATAARTDGAAGVIVLWKAGRVHTAAAGKALLAEHGRKVKRTLYRNAGVLVEASAADAKVVAAQLAKLPEVAAAQPDGRVHICADWTPTDPYYYRQWAYSHIQGPAAWGVTRGSSSVKVAVLDTGVDMTHVDLAANIDTADGYDFVNNDSDPNDDSLGYFGAGHGTHVSGIVAAVSGNGVGVAGTAPGVRVMPVKVMDQNGDGLISDVVDGIFWAADHGASVISMSLGGAGTASEEAAMQSAVDYATNKGVVVVAAAGNHLTSIDPTSVDYPAACTGVIAVGATGSDDAKTAYSNWGTGLDVMAPGDSIYSTLPGSTYGTMSGTSMATPFVAGAAALLRSYRPAATVSQVTTALERTAKDLGVAGYDTSTGYGIIQMYSALSYLTGGDTTPPVTTSDVKASYDDNAVITLSASDGSGSGVAATYLSTDGNPYQRGTRFTIAGYGSHTVSYYSVDAMGNAETPTSKTFTIGDTLPPTTGSDAVSSYDARATIHLAPSDGTGSGVASTRYSLDGATAVTGTTVTTDVMGSHALAFSSTDKLGHVEATKTVDFTVLGVPQVTRLYGADRYETAATASRAAFASASTVVIASGETYPDALSASGLAGALDAPLLLTGRDSLPAATLREIKRLGATKAVLVGGATVIGSGVRAALASAGLSVQPVSGADRYATASAVAAKVASIRSVDTAVLVRGDSFADSLSVSALAAARKLPVLLTKPDALPGATATELRSLGVNRVLIGGGDAAVSASVSDAVDAMTGVNVTRVAGDDRYDTSARLAAYAVAQGWVAPARVGVSSGVSYPDALSGGVATGIEGGALVLTATDALPAPVSDFIAAHGYNGMPIIVYGGTVAIRSTVSTALAALRFH